MLGDDGVVTNRNEPGPLARRSAPLLLRLAALPRWLFVVVPAALLLFGLFVKGVLGGVVLLVLAAFVGWLAALQWPALSPSARGLRLVVPVLLAVIGVVMIGTGG